MLNSQFGFRLTNVNNRRKLLTGFDAFFYGLYGKAKRHPFISRKLLKEAEIIEGLISYTISADDLQRKLQKARIPFRRSKEVSSQELYNALALLSSAVFVVLKMRPYKVQIAGALALYYGYIAEMATGEGKTLTASLTGVLRGWSSFSCHVITANDYLAERDAEELSEFYQFCGVSVGNVVSTSSPEERKQGYSADIVYTTPKEVVADFLRDRLALGEIQDYRKRVTDLLLGKAQSFQLNDVVSQGIYYAIIDEADSVLIDEAVTPLIISSASEDSEFIDACYLIHKVSERLIKEQDYSVDLEFRDIIIHDFDSIEFPPELARKYQNYDFRKEMLRQALVAREFFIINKQYVVQDDKIQIVDEFTGRVMDQRTWSAGLHQLIEAKEGVTITPPNETMARLSFQNYYRMYFHISGMTGTGQEAADELWQVYDLPIVKIPTNRTSKRILHPVAFFKKSEDKYAELLDFVIQKQREKVPVLIGTKSVDASEYIAQQLQRCGVRCSVINAVNQEFEADIITRAGEVGSVTVATNMAGRGTDIKIDKESNELGGLLVIAAEPNDSKRVDRQLYGRSARQGDNGAAILFASLEDDLIVKQVNSSLLNLLNRVPITSRIGSFIITYAQKKAQKQARNSRKMVQKRDAWLEDSLAFTKSEIQ